MAGPKAPKSPDEGIMLGIYFTTNIATLSQGGAFMYIQEQLNFSLLMAVEYHICFANTIALHCIRFLLLILKCMRYKNFHLSFRNCWKS